MPATTKSQLRLNCQGGITIIMAILLLVLSLASAIYTAKTKLLDIRISSADYRKNQALLAAQSGIQHGIAQLDADPSFTGTLTNTVANNSYRVSVSQLLNGTTLANSPLWDHDIILNLTANGDSSDHTSTKTISQKVWLHAIIRTPPHATITSGSMVNVNGGVRIAANATGTVTNTPLSIWSHAMVTINDSTTTCAIDIYDDAQCATSPYSSSDSLASDILIDPFTSHGGSFPRDLFATTFGVPLSQSSALKQMAEQQISDCSKLNINSKGLIWVNGDCEIRRSRTIASATSPLLLIIENGELTLNRFSKIYGLVFLLNSTDSDSNVTLKKSAEIRGALISLPTLNLSGEDAGIRFDPIVLAEIAARSQAQFTRVEVIPGSWQDF